MFSSVIRNKIEGKIAE
jgi:citrate synthase